MFQLYTDTESQRGSDKTCLLTTLVSKWKKKKKKILHFSGPLVESVRLCHTFDFTPQWVWPR